MEAEFHVVESLAQRVDAALGVGDQVRESHDALVVGHDFGGFGDGLDHARVRDLFDQHDQVAEQVFQILEAVPLKNRFLFRKIFGEEVLESEGVAPENLVDLHEAVLRDCLRQLVGELVLFFLFPGGFGLFHEVGQWDHFFIIIGEFVVGVSALDFVSQSDQIA